MISLSGCKTTKDPITEKTGKEKIKVAVFNGFGAGEISVVETIEALKIDTQIEPVEISATEIIDGKLKGLDVIIFPGGSGSKQLNNLGKQASSIITNEVKNEGLGVVGICAGSFLLSTKPDYPSLALGNAKTIKPMHYERGLIEFNLTEEGYKIFPELKNKPLFVQYFDGPILEQLNTDTSFVEIGKYVSATEDPATKTPYKTFIYHQNVGKGKIFAVGGHPESTPGMRWMITRMVRWVADKEMVSYPQKWIVPEYYNKEILFESENTKYEKENWWKLFSNDPKIQIEAMDNLYAVQSRPGVRWYIGMLRDTNPQVRAHAAELLAKTEYTAAMNDLLFAYKNEKNEETKLKIKEAIDKLQF
jgi:glutamine amidotransferase-like uncharacterized protein